MCPASTSHLKPPTARVLKVFQNHLLSWFEVNRRPLPWRKNRTPYRVWISELMLQQTRADQATPYFNRFMLRFPTLNALAKAKRNDVLKQWEGLGYYSRAVRAHDTAQYIVKEKGGSFPQTHEEILNLPGVGPYTAAAIASLAFGLDYAVLDGNVIRVLARAFAFEQVSDSPKARNELQRLLNQLLPHGKAALFNEAMMELGALVCTPTNPNCGDCPLGDICKSRKSGKQTNYPVRKKKKAIPHRHVGAGVIIDDKKRILIAQRQESSMLGGLWEFPGGGVEEGESIPECIARELHEELGLSVLVGPHLISVRHTFSHFRMDLHAHWVRIKSGKPKAIHCADFKWVTLDTISENPLPRADLKVLDAIRKMDEWPAF